MTANTSDEGQPSHQKIPTLPGFVSVVIDGKPWLVEEQEFREAVAAGKLPAGSAIQ
jgi:hypothetical protein